MLPFFRVFSKNNINNNNNIAITTITTIIIIIIINKNKIEISVHYDNTPIHLYLKFHHQKLKAFRQKSGVFHISAQNIDCEYLLKPPRRGGFNKYAQSIFLSKTKKNNVYPCKPHFYYIKMGFKGVKYVGMFS